MEVLKNLGENKNKFNELCDDLGNYTDIIRDNINSASMDTQQKIKELENELENYKIQQRLLVGKKKLEIAKSIYSGNLKAKITIPSKELTDEYLCYVNIEPNKITIDPLDRFNDIKELFVEAGKILSLIDENATGKLIFGNQSKYIIDVTADEKKNIESYNKFWEENGIMIQRMKQEYSL